MPDFVAFSETGLQDSIGIGFGGLVMLGPEHLGREDLVPVVNKSSFIQRHSNSLFRRRTSGLDPAQLKLRQCPVEASSPYS